MTGVPELFIESLPDLSGALCTHIEEKEFFFPEYPSKEQREEIREFCSYCPVKNKCLESALKNQEKHGYWGGLSPRERKQLSPNPNKRVETAIRAEQISQLREAGKSYKEIAQELEISVDNAIQTLVRYRKKMGLTK